MPACVYVQADGRRLARPGGSAAGRLVLCGPWCLPPRSTRPPARLRAPQSLENEAVRAQVLRLVSLPLWHALSRGRMQLELHDQQQLAKHWRHLAKKEAKAAQQARRGRRRKQQPASRCAPGGPGVRAARLTSRLAPRAQEGHVPVEKRPEATFLPGLLDEFVATLEAVVPQEGSAGAALPLGAS